MSRVLLRHGWCSAGSVPLQGYHERYRCAPAASVTPRNASLCVCVTLPVAWLCVCRACRACDNRAQVWDKYAEAANLLLVKPESVAESKAEATPAVESKAGEGKEASDDAAGAGDGAAALPAHRRLICSTIAENAVFMEEILGVKPVAFKPSIPNLVYQYNFYCNYTPTALGEKNPEIPDDD